MPVVTTAQSLTTRGYGLPFGLAFLLPCLLLRGLSWLDRLDLAVVLSFGVSYALFNTRVFEPGVWLAYPPLLYLLARMLWRGLCPAPRAGGSCGSGSRLGRWSADCSS